MSKTVQASPLRHPQLPGVVAYPVNGTVRKGEPQDVLVIVEPEGVIPLHSHNVDAHMFVTDGDAELLSDDPDLNGKLVETGTCVFFERLVNHGFRAGKKGLRFLSQNGGIVDPSGEWDLAVA